MDINLFFGDDEAWRNSPKLTRYAILSSTGGPIFVQLHWRTFMRIDPILKKITIASIFLLFLFLHLPLFELETRQEILLLNAAAIFGCAFPFFFDQKGWGKISTMIVIVAFWILLIYLHSRGHPPITEYARSKFPYFLFMIVIGAIVIPFVIDKYNIWFEFIVALVVFAIIMSIVSFFPSLDSSNARYSVINLSPTMLGKIVVIPLLVFLFYSTDRNITKYILGAIALLGIVACVNTGSRTPLVAVLIVYLIKMILKPNIKIYTQSAFLIAFFFVAFIGYLGIADPQVAERFSPDAFSIEAQSGEGDRLYVWQLALQVIASNPEGLGFGNFSSVFWLNAPHNIWLEALVELGFWVSLPLFALTMIGLYSAFKLMRSQDKIGAFFSSLLFYNVITSLTGNELTLSALFFYISLSCCYLYSQKLNSAKFDKRNTIYRRGRTNPAARSRRAIQRPAV